MKGSSADMWFNITSSHSPRDWKGWLYIDAVLGGIAVIVFLLPVFPLDLFFSLLDKVTNPPLKLNEVWNRNLKLQLSCPWRLSQEWWCHLDPIMGIETPVTAQTHRGWPNLPRRHLHLWIGDVVKWNLTFLLLLCAKTCKTCFLSTHFDYFLLW